MSWHFLIMSWHFLLPSSEAVWGHVGNPLTWGEHEGRRPSPGLLSPAASLVYRLPQSWVGPKLPWKIAHASLHLLAFILTVLGLVAVFRYHNKQHIANLYSLHSWLGITTVFFFACQVGALPAFGFPLPGQPWALPRRTGAGPGLAHCVEAAFAGTPCRWAFERAMETVAPALTLRPSPCWPAVPERREPGVMSRDTRKRRPARMTAGEGVVAAQS